MLDFLRRLYDYDCWANARMRDSLDTLAAPSERLLGLYAHLLSSKRMWLGRIEATADAGINTSPRLSLAESDTLHAQMNERWRSYIDMLDEFVLARIVHYTTAAGDPGQQTVADIVTHSQLHSMYHRGQIAQLVRAEGGKPASTDFVVWTRELRLAAPSV